MKYALLAVLLVPAQDSMTVGDVVAWTTKHAKRRFVADEGSIQLARKLMAAEVDLDAAKAYESGLALLRTAGIAAVPLEDGAVRLVMAQAASREQLKVYNASGDLPKADEFCTLVVTLKHLETREAHMALINLFTPQSIVPVDASRSLVISDFASNLRRAVELLKSIDLPRAPTTWRIAVAVLSGEGGEASVPDGFKDVDLSPVGRSRYTVVGEASARVDVEPAARKWPDVALRLGASRPLLVEYQAGRGADKGPILERFTVRDDKEGTQVGPRLLETRVELRDGSWSLLGTVPGEKEGTSLVILGRALPVR